MIAQMDIQNINIQQEAYQKNIHILVNISSVTKILMDITEYIKLGNIFMQCGRAMSDWVGGWHV
jgi:hypothetical protein